MAIAHHTDASSQPFPHPVPCPCNECELRRWSELRDALEHRYGPIRPREVAPEVLKGLVLSYIMLACLWIGACL